MGGLKSKLRRPKSASRKDKDPSATRQNSKKKKAVNLPDSQSARKTVDPRLPFSNYRQIFSIRNAWKAVSRHMEDNAKETLIRYSIISVLYMITAALVNIRSVANFIIL